MEARAALYQEALRYAASRSLTFEELAERVTGKPFNRAPGYERNMHAGRYARKFALALYTWLLENHPETAARVDMAVRTAEGHPPDTNGADDSLSGLQAEKPELSLWLSEVRDETRFLFRSRAIPFIGQDEAIEQLDAFRDMERNFVWHVLHGPGGTGKSRLALEYMIQLRDAGWGDVGFLSPESADDLDWTLWNPDAPTFMAVDYTARDIDIIAPIVRALALRDGLEHPVRLLLIERELARTWFDKLCHIGRSERFQVNEAWSALDGELEPPEDVWPIIAHMAGESAQHLPVRERALDELHHIDPGGRPLFAAFLGDAYRRGQNPRGWDRIALVENVLDHDRLFWEVGGAGIPHRNLCVAATMLRGIPVEWAAHIESLGPPGFYSDWRSSMELQRLAAIFGYVPASDIPPLEPDIVGEVFVIEAWREFSETEKNGAHQFLRPACALVRRVSGARLC